MKYRWYKLFEFGFPFCHVRCAKNYCRVTYDVGDDLETSYKMGLN